MRRLSLCWLAGTPVMGSRRALSWEMDHEGVIRRSEDEFSDVISRGMSAAVVAMMCGGSSGVEFREVQIVGLGFGPTVGPSGLEPNSLSASDQQV